MTETKPPDPPNSSTAPARRRRRRRDARPQEIVDAGMREFAENGYAGTRLEDVARRAGIAKSTIYLYFKTKEHVFEAAVQAHVGGTLEEVEGLVDGYEGSSATLLQLVLGKIYDRMLFSDARFLMRIIIAEGDKFPHLAERYHQTAIASGTRLLDKIVRRGVARGEFRDGPAVEFPRLLIAPAVLAAIWRLTFDGFEPLDVDRYFAAHVDLVLDGLRAAPR